MKGKIRVLHIIAGLGRGGAESMLSKLVTHDSAATTHEVVSLTSIGPIGEKLRSAGIQVTALGGKGAVSFASLLLHLAVILRRRKPDIVQTWMYHANIIGGVAARLAGHRAVIWNIRASALDPHEKLLTRLLATRTGSLAPLLCRCIITNSSVAVREHVRHGYPERLFQLVPNGFNLEQFRPDPEGAAMLRRELCIPTEAPVVGMIARFHPVKDHASFVRAARMLSDRIKTAHFILAGDGVDDDNLALRDQFARAGLLANTHLLGTQNDLARVLSAMDVFALSSAKGEGFPNVLAEAMACEVPCVATDSGDSRYVVGDAGCIVSPGDAQAMSRAWKIILDMSDQDRRAIGRQGRRRIESHFSLDAIARQYDLVYGECADRA